MFIKIRENGLVEGHAYVVTSLISIRKGKDKGRLKMLKLQNPWGNKCEFKGNWAKNSRSWHLLSENNRRLMLYKVKEQGQFWYLIAVFV